MNILIILKKCVTAAALWIQLRWKNSYYIFVITVILWNKTDISKLVIMHCVQFSKKMQ